MTMVQKKRSVSTRLTLSWLGLIFVLVYLTGESTATNILLVIAQELEKVMPDAVHHIGDVSVSGHNVENLLVVNERMLLLENIGATQHLDKAVKREKEEIEFVNSKVKELEEGKVVAPPMIST